jgi:hypothetical protein
MTVKNMHNKYIEIEMKRQRKKKEEINYNTVQEMYLIQFHHSLVNYSMNN